MLNNQYSRVTNQSFEQNKQQIQQTHDIINVIENKLNNFLQKRGVRQTSPDTFRTSDQKSQNDTYKQQNNSPERVIENKIQQMEMAIESRTLKIQSRLTQLEQENRSLKQENQLINQENRNLQQSFRDIEISQKRQIEEHLDQQRQQLQKQFELQVNDIGQNAKHRLLKTLEQEDKYLVQYNKIVEDKSHLLHQLDQLKYKNKGLEVEREDLAQSYSNLLTMHNQMLQLDVNQNQNQIEQMRMTDSNAPQQNDKSDLIITLKQYKEELDQLKNVNENIQQHMSEELHDLRDELNRQKSENAGLLREMSSMKITDESGAVSKVFSGHKDLNELYKQVFKPQEFIEKTKNVPLRRITYEEEEDEEENFKEIKQSIQVKNPPALPTKGRVGRKREQKKTQKGLNEYTSSKSKSQSKSQSLKRKDVKAIQPKSINDQTKSHKSLNQPADQQARIQQFEKELTRLKVIVNDKIVNKKKREQNHQDEE